LRSFDNNNKRFKQRALYMIRRLSEDLRYNSIRGFSPRRMVLQTIPVVCNKDNLKVLSVSVMSGAAVSLVGMVHLYTDTGFTTKYQHQMEYADASVVRPSAGEFFDDLLASDKTTLAQKNADHPYYRNQDEEIVVAEVADDTPVQPVVYIEGIKQEIASLENQELIKHVLIADSFNNLQDSIERSEFDEEPARGASMMVADASAEVTSDESLTELMPAAGDASASVQSYAPVLADNISVPVMNDQSYVVRDYGDIPAPAVESAETPKMITAEEELSASQESAEAKQVIKVDENNELTPQEISLNFDIEHATEAGDSAIIEDVQVASISGEAAFPKIQHVEAIADSPDAWEKFAVETPFIPQDKPRIAIVIDDLGLDRNRTAEMIKLQSPITMSFMSYAGELDTQTKRAKRAGHELMMHIPMEPISSNINAGPGALKSSMTDEELKWQLSETLSSFDGYVGVNNHMGSKFTSNRHAMDVVIGELNKKGLLFIDSRTTAKSVGYKVAAEKDMPHAVRHVFLDPMPGDAVVKRQLKRLEYVASKRGYAIGIGHPRDATINTLREWLPRLKDKGFALVPVSEVIKYKYANGLMESSKPTMSAQAK
jgi:polysaccharide deacetylase 2 family uncharacterized protein YibQ